MSGKKNKTTPSKKKKIMLQLLKTIFFGQVNILPFQALI